MEIALVGAGSDFAASAVYRDGRGIRHGDSVVVVGHSLRGLLAFAAAVTISVVSALAGLGNDTRYLQLTTPAAPAIAAGHRSTPGGRVVDGGGDEHIIASFVSGFLKP
ncbi:MAG: hypothetical protein H6852_19175 [Geminicoccaceae bacterium]|nr:hypothetical protein [Geminicoccaceae bacterium]MCB9969743.1 hypothetical protein [Geminicoccaceae bacterium]